MIFKESLIILSYNRRGRSFGHSGGFAIKQFINL